MNIFWFRARTAFGVSRASLSTPILRLWILILAAVVLPAAGLAQAKASPEQEKSTDGSAPLSALQHMIDRGQWAQAQEALLPLLAQKPIQPTVRRLQGDVYYALGKYAEADSAYKDAMEQDPADLQAIQMRGLSLFRLGRPADAIPLLSKAHDWNARTRTDPSYVLALCYLDSRRYDDARRAFAAQYDFGPDSAQAYLLSARMFLRRGFLPVSQEYARKAAELDPKLPLVHLLLGEIELAGNHMNEAIKEFEDERSRNPLEAEPYERLGDAYLRAGDDLAASRSLQRAILLEPQATGPYILLGKALLKQQSPANAVMYLEHAESMDANNYMTHWLLGQAYRGVGREADATREVQLTEKLQTANEPKLQGVQ